MSGPESPASSYLVQARGLDPRSGEQRTFSLVCDMGPGSFVALWAHVCPCELDALALSHCHADHMGDIISLQVYRKWGPGAATSALPLYGPAETMRRVRQIEDAPDEEAYEVEFAFTHMQLGEAYRVGPMTIRPYRALHPVEAFGLRIEGPSEEDPERMVSLFYTGDTDLCDTIIEGARGVDVLLSEVGFTSDETEPDMHMDGVRAGQVATRAGVGRMIATHIPSTSRLPGCRSASESFRAPPMGEARCLLSQSPGAEYEALWRFHSARYVATRAGPEASDQP